MFDFNNERVDGWMGGLIVGWMSDCFNGRFIDDGICRWLVGWISNFWVDGRWWINGWMIL